MYALNCTAPKYLTANTNRPEGRKNIAIARDFTTTLSAMHQSPRQKYQQGNVDFNHTLDQWTYRMLERLRARSQGVDRG